MSVSIREVGPRDGFQNEPEVVPTDEKVRLIELLAGLGAEITGPIVLNLWVSSTVKDMDIFATIRSSRTAPTCCGA